MQNNASVSVAGTKVKTINTYDITASTMEILESKRFICEKVLDKCVAVRDYVWNDFLREAAPTIRLAEQNVESKKRQSCLTDISNCIQTACKDDIVGKGTATMDACLARPDMARSFCKVQIDPCERMEPQIWDYVVSKLAAMRVDACTNEVKECVMSEDRCGPDFMNCIGMDFDYIHDMCPIEKLVVCKQTNKDFKISDLDEMLMGLYLNIDNKALENCTKLAEEKMVEVCGSLDGCSVFAKDEYIGTGSIKSQKNGTVYRVTGRMALGALKMGDALGNVKDGNKVLAPGQIGVSDYIQKVKKQNKSVPNADSIIASIESELNSIAGSVDRVISLIESDQQVQYCINGRDLSQINGKGTRNNSTGARFPNLLNQYRVTIAQAALSKAEDNYQKKYAEAIAQATKNASVDVAQYMCQMIPSGVETKVNDSGQTVTGESDYAIVYEIDSGLDANSLMSGGSRTVNFDSASLRADSYLTASIGRTEIPGGTKTIRSTFNRETRVCHICTELVTRECKQKGINLQFFVTDTRRLECGEEKREETCEDVAM